MFSAFVRKFFVKYYFLGLKWIHLVNCCRPKFVSIYFSSGTTSFISPRAGWALTFCIAKKVSKNARKDQAPPNSMFKTQKNRVKFWRAVAQWR